MKTIIMAIIYIGMIIGSGKLAEVICSKYTNNDNIIDVVSTIARTIVIVSIAGTLHINVFPIVDSAFDILVTMFQIVLIGAVAIDSIKKIFGDDNNNYGW